MRPLQKAGGHSAASVRGGYTPLEGHLGSPLHNVKNAVYVSRRAERQGLCVLRRYTSSIGDGVSTRRQPPPPSFTGIVRRIAPRFVGHNSRLFVEEYRTCHYGAGASWLGGVVVEYQWASRALAAQGIFRG